MKFLRFALLVFCATASDSSEDAAAHTSFRDHVRSASRLLALDREERQTLTVREFVRSFSEQPSLRRASSNTRGKSTVADIESTLNEMFDHDELLEISYQEGGGIAVRNPWMHMWLPDMAEASIIIAFILTSGFEIGNAIARKIFYIIAAFIFNAATTKEIFPLFLYFTTCFYTHWYNLMPKLLSTDARDFLFADRGWGLAIENGMEEVLKLLMLAAGAWGTHISHDKLALFAGLGFATFESLNYVETHLHTVDAMAHRLITFFIHPAFTSLAIKYKGIGFLMAWTFHFWYDSVACDFVPLIDDIIPTDAAVFILALLLKKGIMQLQ